MNHHRTQGWVVVAMLCLFATGGNTVCAQWGGGTNIPTMTAKQIRQLQSDASKRNEFVIVDVRSPVESNVSVIPGAITQSAFAQSASQYQGRAIIVYCTSGARSARYARQLSDQGWNVRNYKGSIVDWCRHKYPLATPAGKSTNRVHFNGPPNHIPAEYQTVR